MPVFHAGEIEVQERVGVRAMAERVGNSIHSAMPPPAQQFLRSQPFVVIGGEGTDGRVWTSLLSGEPGFAHALDEGTVQIDATLPEDDPLSKVLEQGAAVGMIALEPATRRRMRLNGWGQSRAGAVLIKVQQVYSNCPKYIQKREWRRETGEGTLVGDIQSGELLEDNQVAWIESADTFFIASRAEGSADASHRGGNPGFVRVLGPNLVQFPDYTGNAMFNTLGNLQRDGRAGLLFLDWRSGATLQLSGRARVLWDGEFPGAERGVELRIERVVERENAMSLRWDFLEASPFNPSV